MATAHGVGREREVLELMAEGRSNAAIAATLHFGDADADAARAPTTAGADADRVSGADPADQNDRRCAPDAAGILTQPYPAP
ncbi:hypothetical protein QMF80_29065 [Streptomyces sp. G-G2]|nr:hypothetical protein [Streptomyces sp. G-G2]MDJ0384806.1 hypothetical protein [Streptomyces sp. G-G2]